MSLTCCQSIPAVDGAIYRSDSTLYQLQPSFHTYPTEPEPTARARRRGRRKGTGTANGQDYYGVDVDEGCQPETALACGTIECKA